MNTRSPFLSRWTAKLATLCTAVAAVGTMGLSSGCKVEVTAKPVGPGIPARRAAQSFVHCVEQQGAACVGYEDKQIAWDSFSMLGWLAAGSPTSILQALPSELGHHQNPRSIQARFVRKVDRNSMLLRGAECRADKATSFAELIPKLRSASQARLEAMGLWRGDLEAVVDQLSKEAGEGLSDGFLITMRCATDPDQLYVATTTQDERYIVVGMLMDLPEFLGGTAPSRDSSTGRLPTIVLDSGSVSSVREGVVDPWIPIPVEEF